MLIRNESSWHCAFGVQTAVVVGREFAKNYRYIYLFTGNVDNKQTKNYTLLYSYTIERFMIAVIQLKGS